MQESRPAIKLICQLFDECPSGPRPDRWAEFERGLTALHPSPLPPPARPHACLADRLIAGQRRGRRDPPVWPPAQKRLGYVIAQLSRTERRSRWDIGDICAVDGHPGIPSPLGGGRPLARISTRRCPIKVGLRRNVLPPSRFRDVAFRCVSFDSRGRSGHPRGRN